MRMITRWLWMERTWPARLARSTLAPISLLYRGAAAGRARAYAAGVLAQSSPELPTIAVGNLTVGGTGKTPVAAWIAQYYGRRGHQPALLLRGYGGDEAQVHRHLTPSALVVENPDRLSGIRTAATRGAAVIVLDDAYQRLDVRRDLDIVLVAAESLGASHWTLPAGPWREPLRALRRADLVVVTRKRMSHAAVADVEFRLRQLGPARPPILAHLGLTGLRGLHSHTRFSLDILRGKRCLVVAGVADPDSFAAQCQDLGADVRPMPMRDHEPFSPRRVAKLLRVGHEVNYVVVTEKDAVKLSPLWPCGEPEPLVAELSVFWESGQAVLENALDTALAEPSTQSR